jgi:hypothetical protein
MFVDEAHLGAVAVRTTHRIDRLDGERIRIVYALKIRGPDADTRGPQPGSEISADFPQLLALLPNEPNTNDAADESRGFLHLRIRPCVGRWHYAGPAPAGLARVQFVLLASRCWLNQDRTNRKSSSPNSPVPTSDDSTSAAHLRRTDELTEFAQTDKSGAAPEHRGRHTRID